MAKSHYLDPLAFFIVLFLQAMLATGQWYSAHATFYGDLQGRGTMGGACGYGDLFQQGYGLATTALSTALFNNGFSCGACFEIICDNDPQWCIKGAGAIRVTATNLCPPNYSKPSGNWCNPPLSHFDLTQKMFTTIAYYRAGIIPVLYRRVPCFKTGGVKFEIRGNPYFFSILVYNVANAGNVYHVSIRGSSTSWMQMFHNWGQIWSVDKVNFVGQALSFQVTTSDGKMLEFDNVIPSYWRFRQTFQANRNF